MADGSATMCNCGGITLPPIARPGWRIVATSDGYGTDGQVIDKGEPMSSLSFNKQDDGSFAVYDADAQLFGYVQENDDHSWSTVSEGGKRGSDAFASQHEAGAALAPDRISPIGSGTGAGAVVNDRELLRGVTDATKGDRWGDTSTAHDAIDVPGRDLKAEGAKTSAK